MIHAYGWCILISLNNNYSILFIEQNALCSFPKKVPPRSNIIPVGSERDVQDILANWPKNVAYSDLWNDNFRNALRDSKVSDGDLDKRRSKVCIIRNLMS